MASLFSEDFESGANGDDLSTANSGFSTIGPGNKPTFTNADVINGSLAMSVITSASANCYVQKSLGSTPVGYFRFYVKFNALPSVNQYFMNLQVGASTACGDIRVGTTQKWAIRNGTTAVYTSTASALTNTWYRVEWMVNGTASTQRLRVYSGANLHGTTPDFDSGDQSYTVGNFDRVGLGLPVAAAGVDAVIDAFAVDDSNWVGPAVASTEWIGNASATVDNSTSYSITLPTWSAGKTGVILLAVDCASNTPTLTTPTGFTLVKNTVANSSVAYYVFQKAMADTDSGAVVSLTWSAATQSSALAVVMGGYTYDLYVDDPKTSGTKIEPPGATASSAPGTVVAFYGGRTVDSDTTTVINSHPVGLIHTQANRSTRTGVVKNSVLGSGVMDFASTTIPDWTGIGGTYSASMNTRFNFVVVLLGGTTGTTPPTCSAGADQVLAGGVTATLSGSDTAGSNAISTRQWTQLDGTTVTLSGAATATATFTVPTLLGGDVLNFQYKVTDSGGNEASDVTQVAALATQDIVWTKTVTVSG